MKYSIIIPVYNRPDEVDELLESLTRQTLTGFEVVVVEDGSAQPCRHVVERYAKQLDVKYYAKPNSGPGPSRNYGAERSLGEWLIFLDSDCLLPPGYLTAVDEALSHERIDAFGGPDRAHESFSPVQKAISYSMTSFFTTGGIRGSSGGRLDKFHPRSFNMGVRATLYRQLGGFSQMRFGEDIDLSIRIFESGARCRLVPGAWVWHKRRTDMRKFFRQVHNSGIARINLYRRHPESLKLVHLLPAVFTVGTILLLLVALLFAVLMLLGGVAMIDTQGCVQGPVVVVVDSLVGLACSLSPLALYALLVGLDSTVRNRSLHVGLLSVRASFTQLIGYGTGFLWAWWLRCVRGRDEELQAFKHTFYS